MKIIETRPRVIAFVLWGHCHNLLDDPRSVVILCRQVIVKGLTQIVWVPSWSLSFLCPYDIKIKKR